MPIDPFVAGSAIVGGSNLLGGVLSGFGSGGSTKRQIKFQDSYARHGIRWRVADAKAAGIHPLAALGANISQPPAIPIGPTTNQQLGAALADAGQSIGYGFMQKARRQDVKLDLEYKRLRNLAMAKEAGVLPMIANPPVTKNDWVVADTPPQPYRIEDQRSPGVSPVLTPSTRIEIMPGGKRLPIAATQGGGIDEDPYGFLQRLGLNLDRHFTAMNYPWDSLVPDRIYRKMEARLQTKPKVPPPKGHIWWYYPVSGTWGPVHKSLVEKTKSGAWRKKRYKDPKRYRIRRPTIF